MHTRYVIAHLVLLATACNNIPARGGTVAILAQRCGPGPEIDDARPVLALDLVGIDTPDEVRLVDELGREIARSPVRQLNQTAVYPVPVILAAGDYYVRLYAGGALEREFMFRIGSHPSGGC